MPSDESELPARLSNLADSIFEDLRMKILRGELQPGERLTGERELATEYGTNRNTLREAVRKLEQARLVTVRHGRGVTVCNFRRTGTLELLSPYLKAGPDGSEAARVVADILEPRVLLLEHATRMAARQADPEDVQRLRELSVLLINAFNGRDAAVVAQGSQRWLDALVDATHSVAIRWIANPFLEALRQTLERVPALWVLESSFPNHLLEVVEAVATGDEESAAASTRRYYCKVDAHLVTLLKLGLSAQRQASRSQSSAGETDT